MASGRGYAVFLSHNSRDKSAVEWLAERLAASGLEPFLDKWDLHAGATFRSELEKALASCTTAVVFFGRHGQGDWQRAEIDILVERALRERGDFRVAPALLEGADEDQVDSFLRRYGWIDFRHSLEDPAVIGQLIAFVEGRPFRRAGDEIPSDLLPYRGLERFDAEHSELFFGRDEEIRKLAMRIRRDPFVAVVGPSGSGKSSLVRAGLHSPLALSIFGDAARPLTLDLRPGAQPLFALADRIRLTADALDIAREPQDPLSWTECEVARLRRDPDTLRARLGSQFAEYSGLIVLLVDQCEELFTLPGKRDGDSAAGAASDAAAFVANLVEVVRGGGDRLRVLITVRADFVGSCLELPGLRSLLQDRLFLLGELDGEGLRAVIRLPAERSGAFFEKGLVELIVKDVEGQPGSLPLLELALKELWRRREGRWLCVDAYQATGGVRGALRQLAEATYEGLPSDRHRGMVRDLMLRLTTLGEGVADTRRRAKRDELYTEGLERAVVDETVTALADKDARLILPYDDGTLEVTHEALIREWPRLRGWLDTNRDQLRLHRQLTEATRSWQDADLSHKEGYLFRQGCLEDAEQLDATGRLRLSVGEREFLKASVALRQTEERRRVRGVRRLQALSALALLLALGAAVFGWVAERQRVEATRQTRLAAAALSRAQYLRAVAAEADMDPNRAMAYLAAALRADPSSLQARDRLFAMLTERPFYLPDGAPLELEGAAQDAAITRDGRLLVATAQAQGDRALRDGRSGEQIPLLPAGSPDGDAAIEELALSRNSAYLVVARAGQAPARWRWEGGHFNPVDVLELPEGDTADRPSSFAVAEDGKVAAIHSGQAVLWYPPDGGRAARVVIPQDAHEVSRSGKPGSEDAAGDWTADQLSFAADGAVLASAVSKSDRYGENYHAIRVLDLRKPSVWSPPLTFVSDDQGARYMGVLAAGDRGFIPVVSDSGMGAALQAYGFLLAFPNWDSADEQSYEYQTIVEYQGGIAALGSHGGPTGDVALISLDNGRVSFHAVADPSFDERLYAGSDVHAGEPEYSGLPLWGERASLVTNAAGGDLLATAAVDAVGGKTRIQSWRRYDGGGLRAADVRVEGLDVPKELPGHEDSLSAELGQLHAQLAPDSPESLVIVDNSTGKTICSRVSWLGEAVGVDRRISWLAFGPGGHTLAVGVHQNAIAGEAFLIDLDRCELGSPRLRGGAVFDGALSPDGQRMALLYDNVYGGNSVAVQVWDLQTGTPLTSPIAPAQLDGARLGPDASFRRVTFEPGGDRLRVSGTYHPKQTGGDPVAGETEEQAFEARVRIGLPTTPSWGESLWLADLAEIVGGFRVTAGGAAELIGDRYLALDGLREALGKAPASDPQARLVIHLLNPSTAPGAFEAGF